MQPSISGTLGCLAHFHASTHTDVDTTASDTQLSDEAFSGTLQEDSEGLMFVCTLPELSGSALDLELSFGTKDDTDMASAILTGTHTEKSSFLFVPYTNTASFTDTYILTKLD